MSTVVLRFRDLYIPEGETIRRHRAKIEAHGCVWWGWIMRQRERFPGPLLANLAQELDKGGGKDIFLYHSGEGCLYPATLSDIAAYPDGARTPTPEVHKTPNYMAEAECPAWFQLNHIGEPVRQPFRLQLQSFPSLPELPEIDERLAQSGLHEVDELRLSTATLWEAEITAT